MAKSGTLKIQDVLKDYLVGKKLGAGATRCCGFLFATAIMFPPVLCR